jgi:5-methylcytosine-specific restriction enzyme subunit McrC
MNQISPFQEWETSEEVKLSKDDLDFLRHTVNVDSRGKAKENSKIEIIPLGNDKFKLRAKSYVGSIKIPNSHIIQITPKIKVANFFKLLAYSENFSDIDFFEELGTAEEGNDLLEWIAKLFIKFVNEIIQEGIYKSYVSRSEEISAIKGRLLVANNIRSPRITHEKFWCEFDELSTNTLENQILLYCSKLIFELVKDEKLKDDLHHIQIAFEQQDVESVFLDLYHLDLITYQKFNEHYENSFKLCEYILKHTWYGNFSNEGDMQIFGALHNMNDLFQNFVTKALQETYTKYKVKKEPRDSVLLQKQKKSTIHSNIKAFTKPGNLKPDIVIYEKDHTSEPKIVIDTKYKKDNPSAGDYYQSLAYSLTLDCPVLLLLPELSEQRKGDYELVPELNKEALIYVRTIDFSEVPDEDYLEVLKNRLKVEIDEILVK